MRYQAGLGVVGSLARLLSPFCQKIAGGDSIGSLFASFDDWG